MAEITEEDKQLLRAFKELKLAPKADTPEDLAAWLKDFSNKDVDIKPVVDKSTTVTVSNQQPRLSIFYGDTTTLTKGEATYDQWRYELTSLMYEKTYKETNILQAVRRSVKGEASRILMRLGPAAGIVQILEKLDSVYGVIDSKETLLAKFYSAKQKEDEDVTAWSCRLEDVLNRAVERKLVQPTDINDMLRSMFWTGMRQDLKDISGYKYEAIHDFDKLRVEMRKLEQEHKRSTDDKASTRATIKSVTESETEHMRSEMQELKGVIASLSATVSNIDKRLTSMSSGSDRHTDDQYENRGRRNRQQSPDQERQQYSAENATGYDRNSYQQGRKHYSSQRGNKRGNSRYQQDYNRRDRGRRYEEPNRQYQSNRSEGSENRMDPDSQEGPICYRCRQRGHFQWQCKVRLDHSHHLN